MKTLQTIQNEIIKPAVNKAAGEAMETFCRYIAWYLRPDQDRPARTLEDLVTTLRGRFKLTLPIVPQLTKFLAELGIEMIWFEQQENVNVDGFYSYDSPSQRWQIHIPSGLSIFEPRAILHETFEIFFWRCYHTIEWFPQWAIDNKILDPHEKADEFAFLMMLPRQKFCNLAHKMDCDLWQLASRCNVHPSPCFNAISRYMKFSYPFFHLRLNFGAKPDQPTMQFDDNYLQAKIIGKACKYPKDESLGSDWENVAPEVREKWLLMDHFGAFRPKGEFLDIPSTDVTAIALARQETVTAETDRVAGCLLDGSVSVIARPGEKSQVYVQVIPCGHADPRKAEPVDPHVAWPLMPSRSRGVAPR